MELPDPSDQLVDRMLSELLSGERPPDLSGAILRRAAEFQTLRQRRIRWWGSGIAAAVLLALTGVWLISGRWSYPAPAGHGALVVAEGRSLGRGAVVSSTGEATLDLGGYAHLSLAPASRLTIEGQARDESVYLQAGEVLSEVDSKHGSFSVRTDDGIVRVKGTRFLVAVRPTDRGESMATRTTFVKVLAGTVIVSGAWGAQAVQAGMEMTMPPSQTLADKPAAEFTYVRGTIKAVDAKAKTLTVEVKGGELKTVVCTDKTEIVKGKTAYTDALKVGDAITARIKDNVAVRIEVHADAPKPTGDAK